MREVELAAAAVERLFSGLATPAREIEAAVAPFRLQLVPLSGAVRASGDPAGLILARDILHYVGEALKTTGGLSDQMIRETAAAAIENALKHDLAFRLTGLPHAVRPMSLSQVAFMEALLHDRHELIFGVGPTGTGKTHLAVAAGVTLVAEERFKSFIVTRPRVRLEGEVMTPALRAETAYDEQLTPIEDVLHELIGHDELKRMIDHGLIQILPLGRLRGRSFNDAFVLIDEAQNMTVRNMRMALTRLGRASRMVVTGDPRQVDLPSEETSGLLHILRLISGTDLALIHRFSNQQIIRNDLVARLEALYSQGDSPEVRAAA